MSGLESAIAAAFIGACLDELEAPKPGNVHVYADGHGWTVADFQRSAEAAAPAIARADASIGARVLGAIEATHAAVGYNTNLGIVLLCAPLACAAQSRLPPRPDAMARLMRKLEVGDAELVFRAIALAAPGGLGRVDRHDVFQPAAVTLLDAMVEAAPRDSIARQYANGFADIYDLGAPWLQDSARRWPACPPAATLCVHLGFLATFPDSHIQRKHGLEIALEVQREAMPLFSLSRSLDDPGVLFAQALVLDARLKRRGLNPGASADLTVATLFARRLENIGAEQD